MDKDQVLNWLKQNGKQSTIDGMARYGIRVKRAFGVTMGQLLVLRKKLGKDQALSLALWKTGWYEARLLATLIGEPERVTRRQMDTWAASFESWADCDTACFHLFDRSPFAFEKARQWCKSPREFVKRGGFALIACVALHDKTAPDKQFLTLLPLIKKGAQDERNFVKKGVSWALRGIATRNPALSASASIVAQRLASSEIPSCRWVGKDVLRKTRLRGPGAKRISV